MHYVVGVHQFTLPDGLCTLSNQHAIHDDLISAIETVRTGKKFITSTIAEKLADAIDTGTEKQLHEYLSDREFDVLCLIASGKSITEIATQLSLSTTTVSTYRFRIMEKMNIHSNAKLTRYALENKLI